NAIRRELHAFPTRRSSDLLSLPGNSNEPGDAVGAGEISVLRALSEHGAHTVPQIARLRDTSRQNIQILVNRLASQGLVEFSSNPDRKSTRLNSSNEMTS